MWIDRDRVEKFDKAKVEALIDAPDGTSAFLTTEEAEYLNQIAKEKKLMTNPRSHIKIEVKDDSGIYNCWEFPQAENPVLDVQEDIRDRSHQVRFSFSPLMVEEGFICINRSVPEEPHDEYHTMSELYRYRMLYNAHAAIGWMASGLKVVKSKKHHDGELCFGGEYFIVTVELPTGQVSNHYKLEHWDLFDVPDVELPPEWDGHTPEIAAQRLEDYLARAKAFEIAESESIETQMHRIVLEGFRFSEKDQAVAALNSLIYLVEIYGVATMADLYSKMGQTTSFADDKWGWTDDSLAKHSIIKASGPVVMLMLPKPVAL